MLGWLAGAAQWLVSAAIYLWPTSIGTYDKFIIRTWLGREPQNLGTGVGLFLSIPVFHRSWEVSALEFPFEFGDQYVMDSRGRPYQCEGVADIIVRNPLRFELHKDSWKDTLMNKGRGVIAQAFWDTGVNNDLETEVVRQLEDWMQDIGIELVDFNLTALAPGKVFWVNGNSGTMVLDGGDDDE